jgi:hypothetical protein
MIYYGTADNNVHPSNSMQLIQALQRAGKSFEVQVGPDRGHTGSTRTAMMEFFIENLVLRVAPAGRSSTPHLRAAERLGMGPVGISAHRPPPASVRRLSQPQFSVRTRSMSG